jgi:hypothetical protein
MHFNRLAGVNSILSLVSIGEIIQMENNQDEANAFTCRCGKTFDGAQNIQKHGKKCKFVPAASAVDENEDMTMGEVSNTCAMSCASFLISIA